MNATEMTVLSGLLEEAAQSMQWLSAGMAVCTFARAGKPVPGAKYAEGRWAALRETQRKASANQNLTAVLAQVTTTWESALGRGREARTGPDWIAYYTGGLDALAELTDRSAGPTSCANPSQDS
jgi:hypothetical protein